MGTSLTQLLVVIPQDIQIWNHYAVHFNTTLYVNYISIKKEKRKEKRRGKREEREGEGRGGEERKGKKKRKGFGPGNQPLERTPVGKNCTPIPQESGYRISTLSKNTGTCAPTGPEAKGAVNQKELFLKLILPMSA